MSVSEHCRPAADALAPCAGRRRRAPSGHRPLDGDRLTDVDGLKACPIQFDGHVRLDSRLCVPADNAERHTSYRDRILLRCLSAAVRICTPRLCCVAVV